MSYVPLEKEEVRRGQAKLPEPMHVELATNRHYLHAIRGVRETISSGQLDDKYAIQRLALVLAFLCQYEVRLIRT